MRRELIAVLALLSVGGCSSSPRRPPDAPSTKYRVGDQVTYRYSGSFAPEPVELHERIAAQDGNKLTIVITIRRGSEKQRFLQHVTDTPENQRNDKVDALSLPDGAGWRRVENPSQDELYKLYAWTLPPVGGKPEDLKQVSTEIEFAGARHQCVQEQGRFVGERPARFSFATCPDFLWTNGPAEIVDEADGTMLWKREVLAAPAP